MIFNLERLYVGFFYKMIIICFDWLKKLYEYTSELSIQTSPPVSPSPFYGSPSLTILSLSKDEEGG